MTIAPKILIVDDEPRMCDSLKILLTDQDYRVFTANSGFEAIDHLSGHAFDVILMDMVLPDLNGNQLMDHIKRMAPDAFVVVITGHASIDSAVDVLRKGAYDYLKKPFEFDELLKTVQNALLQKRLKSENETLNRKLASSEMRYRYLVQNSPDIIYTLDRDGNFTFVNSAVERLIGFKTEELIGKHYSAIIVEDDIERAGWHFKERRTGDRATSGVEIRLKVNSDKNPGTANGNGYLTAELKSTGMYDASTRGKNNNYLGTYGVARDISDRLRLESQLKQSQKMEALGTLAGGIAHDFNNLLMGIEGNAALMLLSLDPEHPYHHKLKNIEECVKNGAELTRQLLGFARGGKYQVKPTDLNELIRKNSDMFGRTKKEIKLHTKFKTGIWSVDIDRGQIGQVLLNLFINAWQAMPNGGDLFLQTDNVLLDEFYVKPHRVIEGRYVKVSVTDTGMGMSKAVQARIFDPFFTTKEVDRGTGLGLASAYGIVKNHDGFITVYSETGKGSTFNVYLPASEAKMRPEEKPDVTTILKGCESILIVDDEDIISDVAKHIVENLGYKVTVAKSGKEALDIYRENGPKIDMVILDMIMPEMSGKETYIHLKELDPGIKVLLASGYSLNSQAREILSCGCNGFIQKPFNIHELSYTLREILEKPLSPARVA